MSKFNSKNVEISKFEKKFLPVTYNRLYNFISSRKKKGSIYDGLEVLSYNTSTFYPSGHYKPISKIVKLNVFENDRNK